MFASNHPSILIRLGGMICFNNVSIALSLVALCAGIAVFERLLKISSSFKPEPKYELSNTKYPVVKKVKVDGGGKTEGAEDIISQLPDEILISVIKLLTVRDAVRTSILSKRWRDIYAFLQDVNFNCLHMVGSPNGHSHLYNLYGFQKKFINGVDAFFHRHSDTKIRIIELTCCFAIGFPNEFNQWICSAGRLGVEKLILSFQCTVPRVEHQIEFSFQLQLLSEVPSLEYLKLDACSLEPNLKSQCYSLRTLHFHDVTLVPSALECIMSNCLSLQTLVIHQCKLYPKLRIHGPNLKLEVLSVKNSDVEEIILYAGNLMTFECFYRKMIKFSFDYIPKLQSFSAKLCGEEVMPFLYHELVKDLPQLNSLTFQTSGKFYQGMHSPLGFNMFRNLRQLVLVFYDKFKSDLLSLSLVLDMCPILQEFHLVTEETPYVGEQVKRNVLTDSKLKIVELGGFSGTDNEVSFAKYILKSAKLLEQMYININFQYYRGLGEWGVDHALKWSDDRLEMMCEWLQRQAISKNAQVIFRPVRVVVNTNYFKKSMGDLSTRVTSGSW